MTLRLLLFGLLANSAPATLELRNTSDSKNLELLEDGKPLTTFHDSRVPFLYPLPSASGANLARQWPIETAAEGENTDHPHHRSLWFSHGSVNGFDFWAWTGKGEPRIDILETKIIRASGDDVAFEAKLSWVADGQEQLSETRHYEFRRSGSDTLVINLQSNLTATRGDVLLGDTKEGTMALRVDRSLRLKGPLAKGHIADSEGRTDGDCWGKRSKWVAFHGPDEKNEPAVLAILDHPSNLRHPCWWHARDYGLLAANPFGIHDFEGKKDKTLGNHTLAKGDSLEFRYRIILHHGELTSANLEEHWNTFAKP